MPSDAPYDIIVVGAGHAGCEAALAPARCGCRVLLLSLDAGNPAQMSCNPAIGGIAKGHLVREIDALGGEMARNADMTGIQFRMLNRSKGPAVWSPRSQNDRKRYSVRMGKILRITPRLTCAAGEAAGIAVKRGKIEGITMKTGETIRARAVIITCGTFLRGKIFRGRETYAAGRIDEPPAGSLTGNLERCGIRSGRLKTGTPPRIDGKTVDWSRFDRQDGDHNPQPFSFRTERIPLPQVPCFLGFTTEKTHEILREGFDDSPLFSGRIAGAGHRYCPSIEDKIRRFPGKNRHQIFLEPEGLDTTLYYVNGFSTSLPPGVQERGLRTVPGMERVKITQYGYAVEYDYFFPDQLKSSLESKSIGGLFFAGQVNGTSGYEEAAAQGIMAGLNAVRMLRNEEPFILSRNEAYIGVLVDDIITKTIDEPYRLFTSRAESRLLLRQDNADERLMHYGRGFGLIAEKTYGRMLAKRDAENRVIAYLRSRRVQPHQANPVLQRASSPPIKTAESLCKLLKRPEISLKQITEIDGGVSDGGGYDLRGNFGAQVEMEIKYEGYIARLKRQINRVAHLENMVLSEHLPYRELPFLSMEARDKLDRFRPGTLGQASRIAGISPSDIANLMIHLRKSGA